MNDLQVKSRLWYSFYQFQKDGGPVNDRINLMKLPSDLELTSK